ncbi:MAG TPA: DUF5602 domain-containing protein [Methylomirabilota bacterium]|jgi:hypothetical protein|nr:DUF5602 domain-containing protein [Methylomirabilota bacterium]
MLKRAFGTAVLAAALGLVVANAAPATAQETAPPGGAFQKVSALVPLPDYLPGIGTLYVDPKTLPVGPFLAYDREGKLVSTIYMVPLKDLEAKKAFDDLAAAQEKVDHVDLYFNAGHPGVAEPHYHVVVWYVSRERAASLK